jgi:transcriptional regulator with XRE-family HTH domain
LIGRGWSTVTGNNIPHIGQGGFLLELTRYVGERIRQLRNQHGGGSGISQEALANALHTAANTISRWETGAYKPSLHDLDALSRFFGVSILEFFPREDVPAESKVSALLRAARDLPDDDIDELRKYAEFRRARAMLGDNSGKRKGGRPRTK